MNKPTTNIRPQATVKWQEIETVLLDMDGTLLDKYFDDYFWEEYVPKVYSEHNELSRTEAEKQLLATYKSVENTLQWTDLDYWSERLGLDIPLLKVSIRHLINVHEHSCSFLEFVRSMGKKLHLVTNAHSKTLRIKLDKTGIEHYFDRIICSEEMGEAKENIQFWYNLEEELNFNKAQTLFADDTEKVLHSARQYGIEHLLHIAKPSSRLPVRYSAEFTSIADFGELLEQQK